jgi:hypothetical protein
MMNDAEKQQKRDELMVQFQANPIAFVRALSSARVQNGQQPAPNTHLLSWAGGRPHDHGLFGQNIIEKMLDYILELEERLVEDVEEFRGKSLKAITQKRELSGFNKAK